MTGHNRRLKITLLLAAAIGAMMIPSGVHAEEDFYAGGEPPPVYNGLPEIEIDGSVLQQLGNGASASGAQPIQLVPPPEMAAPSLAMPTLTAPEYAGPSTAAAKPGVPTLTAIAGEGALPSAMPHARPVIRDVPLQVKKPVIAEKEIVAQPLSALKTAIKPVIREIPAREEKETTAVAPAQPEKVPAIIAAKAPEPVSARAVPPVPPSKPRVPSMAVADAAPAAPQPAVPPVIKNESEMKISAQTVHSIIEEIASAPLAQSAAEPEKAAPVAAVAEPKTIKPAQLEEKEILPPMPGKNLAALKAFESIKPPEPGSVAVFPVKVKVRDTTASVPAPNPAAAAAETNSVRVAPVETAALAPVIKEIPAPVPAPEKVARITPEVKAPEKLPEKTPEKIKVWNNNAIEPVVLGPAPVFTLPESKPVQQEVAAIPVPPVPGAKPVTKESPAPAAAETIHEEEVAPAPEAIAAVAPPAAKETQNEEWRQVEPAVVIKAEVPVPGRRPEKQMASQEFVQQARRTILETYTVMRNDGVPMPAVAKEDVTQENLAPVRMSVADLENDPLAAKILDMTPEEVAATLNKVTPSAGRQLSRELNAVSKPRIIRQEGERIFKPRRNPEPVSVDPVSDDAAVTEKDSTPAIIPSDEQMPVPPAEIASKAPESAVIKGERLDLALPFAVGTVDLPEDAKMQMDNGVIPVLKSRDGMRIQIIAFASPTEGKEATARRTALSRALAVRSYLISQGVDATRMDVRALGIQTDPAAAKDKVDLLLVMPEKI